MIYLLWMPTVSGFTYLHTVIGHLEYYVFVYYIEIFLVDWIFIIMTSDRNTKQLWYKYKEFLKDTIV